MAKPVRLAMWSGPRNISTAMMRSWGNRPDALVWDEPLYAHYLAHTGIDHPGAADVIAAGETNWEAVVEALLAPLPSGKSLFFQKHMSHHLLPHVSREWMLKVTNCFLIRDPRRVLASYIKTRPDATLADIGIVQQLEIYDYCVRAGQTPMVVDSRDILADPARMLRAMCAELNVHFTEAMLHWSPGLHENDGVWAAHWYTNVVNSSGFTPYVESPVSLPARYESMADEATHAYRALYERRVRV
ncbi:MAG: HAD family hydrolase [Gammaproteobacteria bacterium]|nr:HAD family hydrolase [Gammaproteobacteria bacterium]